MKRLLVNIRGTNGSGKSTIPMSMLDDPKMYVVEKPYQGKQKKIATVFPSYGWVALGSYLNKTGGLDTFPNKDLTQKTLWYILKKYPEYNILMEGIIASTILSTYITLFNQVEQKYPETKVVVLTLTPPLDVCIQRVYQRNGGKPIKEDSVSSKYKTVLKNIDKFSQAGFVSVSLDTSTVKKKDMLTEFFRMMSEEEQYAFRKKRIRRK